LRGGIIFKGTKDRRKRPQRGRSIAPEKNEVALLWEGVQGGGTKGQLDLTPSERSQKASKKA